MLHDHPRGTRATPCAKERRVKKPMTAIGSTLSAPRQRFFVEARKRDTGDAEAHRGGVLTPYSAILAHRWRHRLKTGGKRLEKPRDLDQFWRLPGTRLTISGSGAIPAKTLD